MRVFKGNFKEEEFIGIQLYYKCIEGFGSLGT
jgi:hypothetical protein